MTTASTNSLWWETLGDEIECPITLEPINGLPYPPFLLGKGNYFDGRSLASYIVSRGVFLNPLTREKLGWEDCRRLDEYLKAYGQGEIHVLEAFALRESINIRSAAPNYSNSSGGNPALEESRQRRVEYLRSEATAALSGLFDYNSNNNQKNNVARRQRQPTSATSFCGNNNKNNPQQQLPPVFGFNLHPTTESNGDDDGYGMVVIDDDDAVRQESERVEYQQLQDAFPRLSTQSEDPSNVTTTTTTVGDDRAIQQIKTQAEQDRLQELVRKQAMQWAKSQLEQEALQRKQERQKRKEAAKVQAEQTYQQQQHDKNEMERARAEIEAWREAHWERLRRKADQQRERERLKTEAKQLLKQVAERQEEEKEVKVEEAEELLEEEKLTKQKAAKAAKRKRAKDRKKAQKVQEKQQHEEKEKQAALQAEKEASKSKCAACQGGIVGHSFEKFGHHFCSTTCARSGPSSSS